MQERWAFIKTLKNNIRFVILALVALLVILADQITALLAKHYLSNGPVHVTNFLKLKLFYNSGVAFGIGKGFGLELVAVGLVFVVAVLLFSGYTSTLTGAIAVGLILGGALGNLIDRIFQGGEVLDFIDVSHWPTFNVADASIVCGGILLLIVVIYGRKTGGKRAANGVVNTS
ncbi:MAG: signal peptidase II [Actinobacteria bacterium]|nr:signal peptidase II [Actinomycetota bacterium]MCL6104620.1 signal peptidase II [Actinomycetota bacterium]